MTVRFRVSVKWSVYEHDLPASEFDGDYVQDINDAFCEAAGSNLAEFRSELATGNVEVRVRRVDHTQDLTDRVEVYHAVLEISGGAQGGWPCYVNLSQNLEIPQWWTTCSHWTP